jgi:tetratricopeptide (TPR) repeat protein
MNRGARFWMLLAGFQIVFGLVVFGITRQYYLEQGRSVAARTGGAPHAMPSLPAASGEDDLARLISAVPGPGGAAVARNPDELTRLGDQLFSQGRYPAAADHYAAALEAGDTDVNTYNSLGLTLHYLGRSGEAVQVLNEGVALDDGYQRIWLTLGFVHGQLGQADLARQALETAVQLDPQSDVGRSATDMLQQLNGG